MAISSNSQRTGDGHSSRGSSISGGMRSSCEAIIFYLCWALFGLLSLCWSPIAAVLYLVLPRRLSGPLGRFVITSCFRMFISLLKFFRLIKCDLTALDALKKNAPLIIAPNHPGRLDAFLMISHLPGTVCIIKAPLWKNLFLGGGARLAGYIRNDAPMDMVRTAVREVQNGRNLLVFPEGTRSTGTSLGDFHGGFALIARFAHAPIQTVFIENVSGYLGKGWPLFKRPTFPLEFRVRLGRRFDVPAKVEAFVAELENYYRDELGIGPPAPAIQA
jgi:1-acyl-sn-glycerol-3-phosphate acyltransferase